MTLTASQEQALENIHSTVSKQADQIKQFETAVEGFSAPVYAPQNSPGQVLTAQEETKKKERHDFGDFCASIYCANGGKGNLSPEDAQAKLYNHYESGQRSGDDGIHTQVLSEASGTAGGYLVPQEFRNELFDMAAENAVVRPRATVMRMTSRSMVVPAVDLTTDAGADETQFFGGVKASWIETDTQKPVTEPAFRNMEFVAHELAGYTEVGNGLLADSGTALGPFLNKSFAGAINWYEDLAFLKGTGSGQPLGIINSPCKITVDKTVADDFVLANAASMIAKLLPSSQGSSSTVWIMNLGVLEKLVSFADSSNVIWIPNARQALPIALFGIPIIFTEKLPALTSTDNNSVILADLSYYWIGDRQDSEISASIHANFTQNQTVWRFSHRVDGQAALNGPINLADGSDCSPFIALGGDP